MPEDLVMPEKICDTCILDDICDWWNVCTGFCADCRAAPFNIEQWCSHRCAKKFWLETHGISSAEPRDDIKEEEQDGQNHAVHGTRNRAD